VCARLPPTFPSNTLALYGEGQVQPQKRLVDPSARSQDEHIVAMLSNPLQRFSPYHNLPSSTLMSNGHVPPAPMHSNGMDPMSQNPHYGMQQLQHVGVSNPHLARSAPQPRQRQHPYGPNGRSSGTSGPVRRRISRACDQCNQLRTKCDGQHPCAHCIGKKRTLKLQQ
jgi:hypothetical protein